MRAIVNALKMTHAAAGIPQQHGFVNDFTISRMRMIIIFVLMQLFLLNTTFNQYMPVIHICKWAFFDGYSYMRVQKDKKPLSQRTTALTIY
ncbi:hypothetical protein MKX68_15620 [Paenibacillus sp. FSL M8-0212]|uniref:hypothetical protein n=1 Tax=Paenibacillus sp. FSL M8-0212 TaxID=2921618 RepID=UPI0030F6699A